MDFAFDETQKDIQTLAASIFERATPERIKEIESTTHGVDNELWFDLAKADLLGVALPTEAGGSGHGIMELAVLLQEMGRRAAPVPLLSTIAFAAVPVAKFASPDERERILKPVIDGSTFLTASLEPGAPVPIAPIAERIVIVDGDRVLLVDAADARIEPTRSTHRQLQGYVSYLDGAVLAEGPDAVAFVRRHALAALCATAVGVFEEALRITASYISERKQFDKPIAAFQGATIHAADAYIDLEAIRATTWSAIWRLSEGLACDEELAIAKYWVAEGGQRIVHACQHLHGGIGVDVDYPIGRYFLWAKYLELTLGGTSEQLVTIGDTF